MPEIGLDESLADRPGIGRGVRGNVIRIVTPLTIQDEALAEGLTRLEQNFAQAVV